MLKKTTAATSSATQRHLIWVHFVLDKLFLLNWNLYEKLDIFDRSKFFTESPTIKKKLFVLELNRDVIESSTIERMSRAQSISLERMKSRCAKTVALMLYPSLDRMSFARLRPLCITRTWNKLRQNCNPFILISFTLVTVHCNGPTSYCKFVLTICLVSIQI